MKTRSPKVLHIDLETYSPVDLGKSSVYKYCEDAGFQILLLAFAYNDDPVQVIEMPDETTVPKQLLDDIRNPDVTKVAHNASFERVCLSYAFGNGEDHQYLDPKAWYCTMIHACELGLPASLKHCAEAVGCELAKDSAGTQLINYFSKPCKPTKANGGRTRNLPEHDHEKWERFIFYNRRDVEVEQEIYDKLQKYPMPDEEWERYCVDQRINDNGVRLQMTMVNNIVDRYPLMLREMKEQCEGLTGGIKLNSVAQLKEWIYERTGMDIKTLNKATIETLLQDDLPDDVRKVLELRLESGSSSIKKYVAMTKCVSDDDRVRGCFRFYGGRTGRWAGRLVQFQNMPSRLAFYDFDPARECVLKGDFDMLATLYGSITEAVKTLIRTVIVPADGHKLIVADYSAIEARVIAWLADETWRMEAFAQGKDIYCASASQMFGVPVEKHGINADLRKKGKVAELGLGYGGSVGALKAFGADKMGLNEEEMFALVRKWREASPKIVKLWRSIETCFKRCINGENVSLHHGIRFIRKPGFVFVRLPSGRSMTYWMPAVEDGKVTYQKHNGVRAQRVDTFGGKLTENIIQAIARDCLAVALDRVDKRTGFKTIAHVHDEIICEAPAEFADQCLERLEVLMADPIDWAPGLLLTADGFTSDYYKKD
ncbi:DNA polymerase [uncultured Dubosiella sp.]|uniref:DNA polymerase n=1 Tax=uncultured Dubosiella sp. TaxID=1937011 RepID=UPI00272F1EA8|nr:DNA polymerase [uncultured Dubosiella sp.]